MTKPDMPTVDLDALESAIADLTPRCGYHDDRPAVFEYFETDLVYQLCAECGDERECGEDEALPDHVGTLRAAVEELRALRAAVRVSGPVDLDAVEARGRAAGEAALPCDSAVMTCYGAQKSWSVDVGDTELAHFLRQDDAHALSRRLNALSAAVRDIPGLTAEIRALRAREAGVAERDAIRADLADVREHHRLAWEALCDIGERVDAAGHPTLIPERALRVGDAVRGLVEERDALRADLDEIRLWLSVGCMPAETYRPGNEAALKRMDAQLAEMRREVEELRLTLLNERGEGEPPCKGWAWQDWGMWGWVWAWRDGDTWITLHRTYAQHEWFIQASPSGAARLGAAYRVRHQTARAGIRAISAIVGGSDA